MNDNKARFMLAVAAVVIAAAALAGLMFRAAPSANREALFLALGLILGLSKDAFSFYFGASKGGVDLAERNQGIVEQQATSATAPPAPASAKLAAQTVADEAQGAADSIAGEGPVRWDQRP